MTETKMIEKAPNSNEDPKWLRRLAHLLSHEEYVELANRVRRLRAATDTLEYAVEELRRALRDSVGDGATQNTRTGNSEWYQCICSNPQLDPHPECHVTQVVGGSHEQGAVVRVTVGKNSPQISDEPERVILCEIPPAGWYCTRGHGHDGPCAAHREDFETVDATPEWSLQHAHGRDGLSREAVADAIYTQAEEEPEPAPELPGASLARDIELLQIPWPWTYGIYKSVGPDKPVYVVAGATLRVDPSGVIVPHNGRNRFRVYCLTCAEELEHATTNATSCVVSHLNDRHGFYGAVSHQGESE